jgi:hypothetical protein
MRDAIHKEIEKLKTTDVTDAELAMYKTRTRADLLRGLADNQGLANDLAEYQTRYGDWRELFLQLDKVDKVTKADIRRVANQVFVPAIEPAHGLRPKPPGNKPADAKMEARNENSTGNGGNREQGNNKIDVQSEGAGAFRPLNPRPPKRPGFSRGHYATVELAGWDQPCASSWCRSFLDHRCHVALCACPIAAPRPAGKSPGREFPSPSCTTSSRSSPNASS